MKVLKLMPILISLLFLAACKKDPPIDPEPTEPVMPPLTHQGLNTFGCYINGELFVANEGESVWSIPPVSGSFNEGTRYLGLQGTRYRNSQLNDSYVYDDVRLRAYIEFGVSVYDFEIFAGGINGYTAMLSGDCDYYYEDIPDLGQLTITYLNEEKNIISGTFYINLINTSCESDTLMKITDGRFDFHY
jgi:hypothetical protein